MLLCHELRKDPSRKMEGNPNLKPPLPTRFKGPDKCIMSLSLVLLSIRVSMMSHLTYGTAHKRLLCAEPKSSSLCRFLHTEIQLEAQELARLFFLAHWQSEVL